MTDPSAPAELRATLRSASAAQTYSLGEALGRCLEGGHFIGLAGSLGAGKTQLVRGIARGADVPEGDVSSPSFAVVNSYRGRVPLLHADLYRLTDYDELYATGFLELLEDAANAAMVEWIDRIPQVVPQREYLKIVIEMLGEDERALSLEARGPRHVGLAQAWLGAVAPST